MTTYPVSVIIPAHNADTTLERAVTSAIVACAGEVVIIDDGSTDETVKMARLLQALNATAINIIKTQHGSPAIFNAGVCHARNLGIAGARYNLIIPLDADDVLLPDGIAVLCRAWQMASVVYGGCIREETTEIVAAPSPARLSQKNLTGATYLFHREDWKRAGGYHPDFNLGCEDWAFMAALVSTGVQLIRVDEPIYVYSPGGKRAARCAQYADTIKQLLREHYPAVFDAQPSR